jgi:hypothetical protein
MRAILACLLAVPLLVSASVHCEWHSFVVQGKLIVCKTCCVKGCCDTTCDGGRE